jgi:lipid-A-disaccharide synthase-like uncharacterized protein
MNVLFADFMTVIAQPMALFGIIGQVFFTGRFLVQWIVSEKRKESTIPLAFWYFSILGGFLTMIYALWRHDPVFTVAQGSGLFVYTRNLILIHRKEKVRAG